MKLYFTLGEGCPSCSGCGWARCFLWGLPSFSGLWCRCSFLEMGLFRWGLWYRSRAERSRHDLTQIATRKLVSQLRGLSRRWRTLHHKSKGHTGPSRIESCASHEPGRDYFQHDRPRESGDGDTSLCETFWQRFICFRANFAEQHVGVPTSVG